VLLDSAYPYEHPGDYGRLAPPSGEGKKDLGGMGYFSINRHNEHINGLFLDWSVRRIGIKELWTLKWHMQFNTANEWTKAGGIQPEEWPKWMRNFKDY
jgi:prepilin-type processing-associated H-X9-DG protein